MGDHKKALDILQKTNLIANKVARNEQLARIYTAIGEKDKAIEHLE